MNVKNIIIVLILLPLCYGLTGKFTTEKIQIRGNKKFSKRIIKKLILTREKGWFSRPAFHEDLFRDDLKAIKQFYRNHGYLDVQISSQIITVDSTDKRLLLKIFIHEGEQTVIDTISFTGNYVFSGDKLRNIISLKQKKPFNESLLEHDNYNLLAFYAQNGYIDTIVKQKVNRDKEHHLISINYRINEGNQVSINKIRIEGLDKTKPIVVKRELSFKPGEIFNYRKIMESQHRLYQTRLFKSVAIKPILLDSLHREKRDIKVSITEKENGEINMGIGFGSYEMLRFSTELFQNNFGGMGYQIGTRLRASFRLQKFEFSFTNPWLFGTRMKFDLNSFIEHKIEPNYGLKRWGGITTVGKSFSRFAKLALDYKYEDVFYFDIQDSSEVEEENKGNIRSLRISYVRDSRNEQINPRSGSYYDLRVESAGGFLKGSHTFVKLTSEFRFFKSIVRRPLIVLGYRYYCGWMDSFGESLIVPLNERFYAGGDGSIRGYERREVGPKADHYLPVGGKLLLVSNLEIRYPIYKKLGGTIFWDMGNVWQYVSDINLLTVRHGVGIGLRYHSPLGIIRIDTAIKLNRKPGEKLGEIYFNLGQIF